MTLDAVQDHILSCLRSAGAEGVKAPFGLRKREQKALIEAALAELRHDGVIAQIRRGRYELWVLAEHALELEDVCDQLAVFVREQAPDQLFTDSDLKRQLSRNAMAFANEALYWLEADGLLKRVHHARSGQTFFIGLAQSPRETTMTTAHEPHEGTDIERVMTAYLELRRRRGLEFVEISALQDLTRLSHPALEHILLDALRLGRAQVTGTNLAILPQAVAGAAITWQGHRCALIKLQSEA